MGQPIDLTAAAVTRGLTDPRVDLVTRLRMTIASHFILRGQTDGTGVIVDFPEVAEAIEQLMGEYLAGIPHDERGDVFRLFVGHLITATEQALATGDAAEPVQMQ